MNSRIASARGPAVHTTMPRRCLRSGLTVAVLSAALATSQFGGATAQAASGAVATGYYHVHGWSGTGTTTGTAMELDTPSSWAIPENPSNPCDPYYPGGWEPGDCADPTAEEGTANEAVWLVNQNGAATGSIEAGIIDGEIYKGAYTGWDDAWRPYLTYGDDGANEVNANPGWDVSGGVAIDVYLSDGGTNDSEAHVDSAGWGWNWTYDVGTAEYPDRTNYAQGETVYGDDWMGQGSQLPETLLYQPAVDWPNGWNNWGELQCNTEDDSAVKGAPWYEPFDYSYVCGGVGGVHNKWSNGGYGNGAVGS